MKVIDAREKIREKIKEEAKTPLNFSVLYSNQIVMFELISFHAQEGLINMIKLFFPFL